jgi:hypothetical protein
MPQIQHMALLKFKPEITADQIEDLFSQLADLKTLIPGIIYFSAGSYSSDEGLNKDFNHGFLTTFESIKARDNYLPHPEHERVKAKILPCIDDIIVFDFEA